MVNTKNEHWKGFDIETRAIPVRHYAMPPDAADAYVALVRILRAGNAVADWHLPRHAGRWASADEAHRDGVEYAVQGIRSGRFGEGPPALNLAAWRSPCRVAKRARLREATCKRKILSSTVAA